MDDDNSELEELKLERERDRVFGPKHTGDRYERKSPDGGMYKRVLESLIVVTVVALVTTVWNLTQTVTLLSATQAASADSNRREFDRMERRQDMLEGKLTRGGPDASHADQ